MRHVIALLFLLGCNVVWACAFTPSWFKRSHVSLIEDASSIVLVKAESVDDGCKLRAVQVLKGTGKELANVACHVQQSGAREDFSGHRKSLFWKNATGRIDINEDCAAHSPTFELGSMYLAILGVPPDSKQFEQIKAPDDRWLEFVQARLEKH